MWKDRYKYALAILFDGIRGRRGREKSEIQCICVGRWHNKMHSSKLLFKRQNISSQSHYSIVSQKEVRKLRQMG
jgi:hypothetical protein